MIIGLVFLAAIAGGIFLIIRAIAGHSQASSSSGHSVRRFFQYALQFGLVVVVSIGLAGLLDRLFSPASLIRADQISLARNTSFVLVGLPVLLGIANWTRRTLKSDRTEVNSFGWSAYIFLATVTSLATAMVGLAALLAWAFGLEDFSSYSVMQTLVWSTVWALHFEINRRVTPPNRSKFLFLFNSLIGLITSLFGLSLIITGIVREVIGYSTKDVLVGAPSPLKTGAIMLLIGAPVWLLYWIRSAMNSTRDVLWLGYVLIAGVAGGLITAIVSASTLLYRVLVWFLGTPLSADALTHFRAAPTAIGAVAAGLLLLWYHNHFASAARTSTRNEVQRIYEYLISGIALIASTSGLVMVIVSLFDAFARNTILSSTFAINTLLAAITLLLVGTPIWYLYWHRIQIHAKRQPEVEASSGTRRVYLFLLFGAGGVLSVVTLLTGTFILFEAIFAGDPISDLLREIRYPVSILLGTIAITAYHWSIYSSDKEIVSIEQAGPKRIVLIGPADETLRKMLREQTGGNVQLMESVSDETAAWPQDQVLELVKKSDAEKLAITLASGKVTAIELRS